MISQVLTRRKWRLHAHGQHIVIVRGTRERFVHPLMKALIWALYVPEYPAMSVEVRVADRYKPDVVAFAPDDVRFRQDEPVFWGEAGRVSPAKIAALVKRYPDTHFAVGKWASTAGAHTGWLQDAVDGVRRSAPVDLLIFPENASDFIDEKGNIHITFDDIEYVQI